MDAETLVREEILQKSSLRHPNSSTEIRVDESAKLEQNAKVPHYPKIKRVQEWLQHQPILHAGTSDTPPPLASAGTTDCEASGEYTGIFQNLNLIRFFFQLFSFVFFFSESDSAAHNSDSSDEITNSVATYMQEEIVSHCTSTDVIGGSSDILAGKDQESTVNPPSKPIVRTKRRSSERPWSVSCLSQLTQSETKIISKQENSSQGLATHSISESALNTLSTPNSRTVIQTATSSLNNSNSKNSLKKRKVRVRKRLGVSFKFYFYDYNELLRLNK